jgi:hypothetical protein
MNDADDLNVVKHKAMHEPEAIDKQLANAGARIFRDKSAAIGKLFETASGLSNPQEKAFRVRWGVGP